MSTNQYSMCKIWETIKPDTVFCKCKTNTIKNMSALWPSSFNSQLRRGRTTGDGVCCCVELQRRGSRVEAVSVLTLTDRRFKLCLTF